MAPGRNGVHLPRPRAAGRYHRLGLGRRLSPGAALLRADRPGKLDVRQARRPGRCGGLCRELARRARRPARGGAGGDPVPFSCGGGRAPARGAGLCVLSDVTEERRARELLAKHRDAAHRTARLVALGEFASAIAHELNQPLAAIATYNHSCMRMLQSGNPDSGELQQAMHICRDQAKRAGKIIQRLRDLLRPPGPAFTEQNLNELVDAVLGLAEPAARDAGITFECRLAPTPPAVRADRLLVEQVALNLVRNAIEAVETLSPERRRITVATRLEVDGSGTFSVSDLGDGVPREAKERLFDPFVTTKPGGLGLGLSICRSVVEAHGGSIRHHHNDERGDHCVDHAGAVFAFTLPGAACAASQS